MVNESDDDVAFWKEQAELYKYKYEQELETYQENLATSQEIEKELESQLQIAESEREQYKSRYQQVSLQLENLQTSSRKNIDSMNDRINFLEKENAALRINFENASNQVRSLEQLNDDLERANRATAFSMEDFESKLNAALEKNALLENELDEKDNLLITIQRLKDEAKDLQAELNARQKANSQQTQARWSQQMSLNEANMVHSSTAPHSRTYLTDFTEASAQSTTNEIAVIDVAPTVRATALGMISDLLRKISQLETKLSSMYVGYGAPHRASIATPDLLTVDSQPKVSHSANELVSTTTTCEQSCVSKA